MTISKGQAQMIAALAIARRPLGAPRWDEAGVMAAIRKIQAWTIGAVMDEVFLHADDPNAKTPGVIGSGYKPPREQHSRYGSLHPRADEACEHGRYADTCPWAHGGERNVTAAPTSEYLAAKAARNTHTPTGNQGETK